ncbi:hypothetical protein ABK040_014979 [Willaertia magna]
MLQYLIHFCYCIIFYFSLLLNWWYNKIGKWKNKNNNDKNFLNLNEKEITKFPKDLAFVLDSNNIQNKLEPSLIECIYHVIQWSLTIYPKFNENFIESLTFYDKDGILESYFIEIQEYLNKNFNFNNIRILKVENNLNSNFIICNNNNTHIKLPLTLNITYEKITHDESIIARTLKIRFISFNSSGKPNITKLTNQLLNEMKMSLHDNGANNNNKNIDNNVDNDKVDKNNNEEIHEKINEIVQKRVNLYVKEFMPEPNLLIVFSKPVLVLFGFPPLHLRYTEFQHVTIDFDRFTKQDLLKCIYNYITCDQRFGK